jgi:hypothetical protein
MFRQNGLDVQPTNLELAAKGFTGHARFAAKHTALANCEAISLSAGRLSSYDI